MDQPDLTPPQRHVLLILADMANEQGECWPSRSTLMERTGYKETAVKDALRVLQAEGKVVTQPRYAENGRQTSNVYVLCLAGRGRVATPPPVDVDADQESGRGSADDPSPVARRPHVEPPSRTSRKKTSTATQQSPSSRRASRARTDEGWDDPAAAVFASQQEDDDSAPGSRPRRGRNHGPDSAWALNGYYRQHVFVAGQGRVGNTNDGAMRKFFAAAKKAGVSAEVLRLMVDCFVEDPQLFDRAKGHRWKVFIANAPLLQERAERVAKTARIMDPEAEVPTQFGGAIPQAVLDEILAEAG